MRLPLFLRLAAFSLLLHFVCFYASAQTAPPKKHVAVLNFDSPGSPAGSSPAVGAGSADVGKGVSAQLITKLVAGKKYSLLDRDSLCKILKEQTEADTTGLDAYALASKIGRIANLDALIIGAVTRYGPAPPSSSPSSGVHSRKSKAFVQITARVFNVSTGEILTEFLGSGESSELGEITLITDRKSKSTTQILSSGFVQSLLPEATAHAVDQIADQLDAFCDRIPSLSRSFDGLVAEISGNVLTLNIGRRSGVRIGDELKVFREPPSSDTPDNPSGVMPHLQVGTATITEVSDDYSIATFSGPHPARIGDHIKFTTSP